MRFSFLLLAAALGACGSSSGGNGPSGDGPGEIPASWSFETAGRSRGLAIASNGDLVYAVGQGDPPFEETGGVVILDSAGTVKAEIPLAIPPACEGCTRMVFEPNRPHVAGGAAWVSDYHWNFFRIDLSTGDATWARVAGADEVPGIAGLDGAGAIAADGSRALLAGLELAVLDLETASILETISFDGQVRSIVPLDEGHYLLDLTEPFAATGRLALWDAAAGTSETFDLPWPVAALAAADGWVVAALELGLGSYGLVEFGAEEIAELATFEAPVGRIALALLPGERVVAVGSGGIRNPTPPDVLVGSTLLVDADEGPLAVLDTSSVTSLGFSPDGSTLYVTDTAGLKAFTAP